MGEGEIPSLNLNDYKEVSMNIEDLFASISANQKKLIRALLDHPEGLLSSQLAKLTAVSNKSGTMTQEVRDLLEAHGLELVIERQGKGAKWVVKKLSDDIRIHDDIDKVSVQLDKIVMACQEIKGLLY